MIQQKNNNKMSSVDLSNIANYLSLLKCASQVDLDNATGDLEKCQRTVVVHYINHLETLLSSAAVFERLGSQENKKRMLHLFMTTMNSLFKRR